MAQSMARKEFPHFEAVSAMVPVEGGGYNAAIAVKALNMGGAPRFHKVLEGRCSLPPSPPTRLPAPNSNACRASVRKAS
jgi:hypothetical protein